MPALANITVKKADGVTDIVYTGLYPSNGMSDAFFRQDTGAPAALPIGLRSNLKVRVVDNGPKTARRLAVRYEAPFTYQDTTTSLYSAQHRVVGESSITLPVAMSQTAIAEAVHQFCNLMASTLIKACGVEGAPPV